MPSGTTHVQSMPTSYHQRQTDYVNGDESAASILQSVKEQEAQFEALTRELEAERQSVANQLERCKLGSETASMSSISSTDDSFHWKGQQTATESHLEDSDGGGVTDLGGSQLVDSCLRVLQERGIMNQSDAIPEDSSLPYNMMNGDYTQSPYQQPTPGSPHGSQGSYHSGGSGQRYQQQPSLAKLVTTREGQRNTGSVSSQHSEDRGSNHMPYSSYVHPEAREPPPPRFIEHAYGGNPAYNDPYDDQYRDNIPQDQDQFNQDRYNNYSNYSDFERPVDRGDYANVPQNDQYDSQYGDERTDQYVGNSRYDRDETEEKYNERNDGNHYNDYRNYGNYAEQPSQDSYPEHMPYQQHSRDNYQETPPVDERYRASPRPGDELYQPHDDSFNPPMPSDLGRGSNYADFQPGDQYDQRPDEHFIDDRHGNYAEHPLIGVPGDQFSDHPAYSGRPGDKFAPDDSYSDQYRNDSREDVPYEAPPIRSDGYRKAPDSPVSESDHYGPPGYGDNRAVMYEPEVRQFAGETNAPPASHRNYDDMPPQQQPYLDFDPSRRSPSIDSQTRDRWRGPDLPEVIEFLSHPSDAIKANAAAYLQHLCYMDDNMKAKTRSLNAIPALVDLVNNEIPEVHRNACGALKNLSFGRTNEENKKAIKNASGIPALIRLLRKTPDNDIRELVTGVLWNLSSSHELKRPIIDDGLTVIVNSVIIPHSGWDRNVDEDQKPRDVYWSFVFRNASGILRNISSDGDYARTKLRECEGLVDSLTYLVRAAIGKNDIDNKSVENCVCILRNLSFRCQEVDDPDFHKKRSLNRQPENDKEKPGCLGGSKKKKNQTIEQRGRSDSGYQRPRIGPVRGQELLWQPEIVHVYLPLLSDCSNPETLEAAAGAIQNLAACDWQPSIDIRSQVRKEKGLPIIVELLGIEADRVVCAAAAALRNLSLDQRNKELVGKYAMRQLVQKLPTDGTSTETAATDETMCAVIATLHEVIRKNSDFASSLLNENGVERLIYIKNSRGQFSPKVIKFAQAILNVMWKFKELHAEYRRQGWREQNFVTKGLTTPNTLNRGGKSPPNNTLYRPRADLGRSIQRTETTQPIARNQQTRADYTPGTPEEDSYTPHDMHHSRSQQPQPQEQPREPLYAQVNKSMKSRRQDYSPPISTSQRSLIPMDDLNSYSYGHTNTHMRLNSSEGPAGADSWV